MTKISVFTIEADGSRKREEVELDLPEFGPAEDFWCECDESPGSTYHPDELGDDGKRTVKHHYTCDACGRVTQIG